MRKTPTAELVEIKIEQDLGSYVRARRRDGKSWRSIAADLAQDSGMAVSHESLRYWFSDERAVA